MSVNRGSQQGQQGSTGVNRGSTWVSRGQLGFNKDVARPHLHILAWNHETTKTNENRHRNTHATTHSELQCLIVSLLCLFGFLLLLFDPQHCQLFQWQLIGKGTKRVKQLRVLYRTLLTYLYSRIRSTTATAGHIHSSTHSTSNRALPSF